MRAGKHGGASSGEYWPRKGSGALAPSLTLLSSDGFQSFPDPTTLTPLTPEVISKQVQAELLPYALASKHVKLKVLFFA